MSTKIQVRRGTSSEWTTSNPVLATGEIGFETDTSKFKIGDGTTSWTGLNYLDYTDARVEAVISGSDTDDLSEGSTNLYYTDGRADARIAAASIDDLSDVVVTSPEDGQVLVYDDGDWVNDVPGAGVFQLNPIAVTADRTLALTDAGGYLYGPTSGTIRLTIPNDSAVDFPLGTAIILHNRHVFTNPVSRFVIDPASGVTLVGTNDQLIDTQDSTLIDRRFVKRDAAGLLVKFAPNTWSLLSFGVGKFREPPPPPPPA